MDRRLFGKTFKKKYNRKKKEKRTSKTTTQLFESGLGVKGNFS